MKQTPHPHPSDATSPLRGEVKEGRLSALPAQASFWPARIAFHLGMDRREGDVLGRQSSAITPSKIAIDSDGQIALRGK